MNLPPLENTPEPQAPLPADRRTLQQTVAMLAALKRQNAELAEQVQKINEVARKVKGEASTLRTALHVEKTRRERAQVYILNHRSETPTLSLDDVFLPDRDVLAIQDEETGELVEEVDAMVQDTPRFAMILEAEKNRITFQDLLVVLRSFPSSSSDFCFLVMLPTHATATLTMTMMTWKMTELLKPTARKNLLLLTCWTPPAVKKKNLIKTTRIAAMLISGPLPDHQHQREEMPILSRIPLPLLVEA